MNIVLKLMKNEPRVESLVLAAVLHSKHKNVLELLDRHKESFEELGPLAFKTRKGESLPQGGHAKSTRYALLTEDQAYLLLTFSRNTKRIISLKVELVKVFSRFRQHKQAEADYLPYYHELHDQVKTLAESAHQCGRNASERELHININRIINNAFGLETGQRQGLPGHQRVKLTAANVIAMELLKEAIANGYDYEDAYRHVKQGVTALANSGIKLLEAA